MEALFLLADDRWLSLRGPLGLTIQGMIDAVEKPTEKEALLHLVGKETVPSTQKLGIGWFQGLQERELLKDELLQEFLSKLALKIGSIAPKGLCASLKDPEIETSKLLELFVKNNRSLKQFQPLFSPLHAPPRITRILWQTKFAFGDQEISAREALLKTIVDEKGLANCCDSAIKAIVDGGVEVVYGLGGALEPFDAGHHREASKRVLNMFYNCNTTYRSRLIHILWALLTVFGPEREVFLLLALEKMTKTYLPAEQEMSDICDGLTAQLRLMVSMEITLDADLIKHCFKSWMERLFAGYLLPDATLFVWSWCLMHGFGSVSKICEAVLLELQGGLKAAGDLKAVVRTLGVSTRKIESMFLQNRLLSIV